MTGTGDCFIVATELCIQKRGLYKLAHGMVNGSFSTKGLRFAHAWCECGDVVIDKANGNNAKVPKDIYYELGGIEEYEVKRYNFTEVREQLIEKGTWGPWEFDGSVIKTKASVESNELREALEAEINKTTL